MKRDHASGWKCKTVGNCLLVCLAVALHAQDGVPAAKLTSLPPGQTLPIRIVHGVKAGKTKPGSPILGVTTQRVPLGPQLFLAPGARLLGTIVTSTAASVSQPGTLSFQFKTLTQRDQTVPIQTRVLAIANFVQADDTGAPATDFSDRGNPSPANWTTRQVGGDEVVRSGWVGPVVDEHTQRVGFADFHGVYADPTTADRVGADALPRALGVFSTTASGLYGFGDNTALKSNQGIATLTGPSKIIVRTGDQMLLEVLPAGTTTTP